MAYRFKFHESPSKQLKRVVKGEMDCAIEMISRHRGSFGDRVHAARTAVKRIRAVLRFVRLKQPKLWHKENAFFRDAGRELAPLREAVVIRMTMAQLRKQVRPAELRDFAALQRRVRRHSGELLSRRSHNQDVLNRFLRAMRAARRRMVRWKLCLQVSDFMVGFSRSYRLARRAWSPLGLRSNAAHYHRFRKRAKVHAYHCGLLRKAWPKMMRAQQRSLGELDGRLGEEHDLAVLELWLRQHRKEIFPKVFKSCLRRIAMRREKLRREALLLGERFFVEKPGAVEKRLSIWWTTAPLKK